VRLLCNTGLEYIDVKDKTTYEIAKAYLRIFAEKLEIKEKSEEESLSFLTPQN